MTIANETLSNSLGNIKLTDLTYDNFKFFFKNHWVAISIFFFLLNLVQTRFNHLSNIPGPYLAKYTKLWRVYDVFQGQAHLTHMNMHKHLRQNNGGNFSRIGPNHVSVDDPDAIPIIYGFKKRFHKTGFYPIQCISWNNKPALNLFSETNENYHKEQMKLVGTAYNISSLLEMENKIDECTNLIMEQFDKQFLNKPFDLGMWLQYYAFDVVGEVTFNSKLGFLEKGGDVDGMIDAIRGMLKYGAIVGEIPELHKFALGNPLLPYILPSMQTWDKVLTFTLQAVNQRTALKRNGELVTNGVNEGKDMLTRWCNNKAEDRMTTKEIIVHLSTNVFAGSDTTAIALRSILYYLMRDPIRLDKAKKEVDDAYNSGKFMNQNIQYKESKLYLPYINACIQEGMRVHPSVGLTLERFVPQGGATIGNRFFKEGTVVGINAWVLHHDERVFESPDNFLPERWLTEDKEKLKKMEKSIFTFGFGARSCVGKNLSLIEMSKIIPQLLLNYNMELAPGTDWTTSNEWFVQQANLICIIKKRQPGSYQ